MTNNFDGLVGGLLTVMIGGIAIKMTHDMFKEFQKKNGKKNKQNIFNFKY